MKCVDQYVPQNNPYYCQRFQAVEYSQIITTLLRFKYFLYIGEKWKTQNVLADTILLPRLGASRFLVVGFAFLIYSVVQCCWNLVERYTDSHEINSRW